MLVLLLDKQKYNYLEDLEKKTRTVNDAIIQIVNTDLILRGYITTICSLLDNRTLHQDLRKHVGSFYQHLLVLKNNFRRNSAVSAPCGKPTKCFTEHKRSREVLHVHRIFSVAFEFFMKIESVTEEYWFLAVRESCKHLTLILEDKAIRICIRLLSAMFEYAEDKKVFTFEGNTQIFPRGFEMFFFVRLLTCSDINRLQNFNVKKNIK